jgi:hypothetical protein
MKLIVDYNLPHVTEAINRLGAVKAKTSIDYGFQQHTEDAVLVKATLDLKCMLLTLNKRTINERVFPPCTHGGILILKVRRPTEDLVYRVLKGFCQSGKRALASHSVTHLYEKRAVTYTCNDLVEVRW